MKHFLEMRCKYRASFSFDQTFHHFFLKITSSGHERQPEGMPHETRISRIRECHTPEKQHFIRRQTDSGHGADKTASSKEKEPPVSTGPTDPPADRGFETSARKRSLPHTKSPDLLPESPFHIVVYAFHNAVCTFHTVVYTFQTVKRKFCRQDTVSPTAPAAFPAGQTKAFF